MKPPNKNSLQSPAAKAFKKVKPFRLNKLRDKADRALQDHYRATYEGTPCESCGRPFQVMHHYVEKSQSAGLRFEPKNLIFLCHACHFRHHRTGDSMIMGEVIRKRGMKWLNEIRRLKYERKMVLDRVYLGKQLEKYTTK